MIFNGIAFDDRLLGSFCRQNGIRRLSLFGSILTQRFTADSDIDLLVEFEANRRVSLFDIGGMTADLRELLGREVDLRTAGDLSIYFCDDVIRQARKLYAAA